MRSPRPFLARFLPSIAALLLQGCSPQSPSPTSPALHDAFASERSFASAPSSAGSFFPLEIGNRWHATAEQRTVFVDLTTTPPTENVLLYQHDFTRELIGTEIRFGRSYTVQEESIVTTGGPFGSRTFLQWLRYRQDRSGLYEADLPMGIPPDLGMASARAPVGSAGGASTLPAEIAAKVDPARRAAYEAAWRELRARAAALRGPMHASDGARRPGGVLDNEITRLRYPLRPGSEWVVRPDPLFQSVVEAFENLTLPAGRFGAYRIRITNLSQDSDDRVHAWYGRAGFLQLRYSLRAAVRDEQGQIIGSIAEDYEEQVDEVDLAGSR